MANQRPPNAAAIRRIVKSDQSPWLVGKSYAVQPGRAKKAVGRIAATRVRQERVGDISAKDARAEGFGSRKEFFAAWRQIHGELDLSTRV
jgi:hypothetical protein